MQSQYEQEYQTKHVQPPVVDLSIRCESLTTFTGNTGLNSQQKSDFKGDRMVSCRTENFDNQENFDMK